MRSRLRKSLLSLGKILLLLIILFCGYLVVISCIVVWDFEVKLKSRPVYIHAAPFLLRVGDDIEKKGLMERLARLGYVEAPNFIPMPGQWKRAGEDLRINLAHSPLKGLGIVTGPVLLSLDWNTVRTIRLQRSGETVERMVLEPELLDIIPPRGWGRVLCRPLPLEQINPLLVAAVLLTEDARFRTHYGIDPVSIVHALKTSIKAGRYVVGASTITQQLIRMTLLTPKKTLWRKVNEIFLALVADTLYSKERILQAYLNRVYLGHWGSFPVLGVGAASTLFFGRDQKDLDAGQCALLAAIIQAPNLLNPHRNPARARSRRNMILGLLLKAGKISRGRHDRLIDSPPVMRTAAAAPVKARAFLKLVRSSVDQGIAEASPGISAIDVTTSLDPLVQVRSRRILKTLGKLSESAFLISADPESGRVRAFITASNGWSGEGASPDTVLPLLMIPALTPDRRGRVDFTLTTTIFVPDRSGPPVTVRDAFHRYRGALLKRLLASMEGQELVDALARFGIRARIDSEKRLSVQPLTPLEVARIYSLVATLGNAGSLNPGLRIVGSGEWTERVKRVRVDVDPAALFIVNHLLRSLASISMRNGMRRGMRPGVSRFEARDDRGMWNLVFAPDRLLLLRVAAKGHAVGLLRRVTTALVQEQLFGPVVSRTIPRGILFRKICTRSGLRATSLCPRVIVESFFKGTQPTEWCPLRHE